MTTKIQIRRGVESHWLDVDPILAEGEIAFVKDKNYIKIGDGVKAFSQLDKISGGGDIIGSPSGEGDLEIAKTPEGVDIVQLKDREYSPVNFSGSGYKIIRKNINEEGKNALTQEMLNAENTVYEIRYDYDLLGGKIIIPDNCVLKFSGGSFDNGILDTNECQIEGTYAAFGSDLILENVFNELEFDYFKVTKVKMGVYSTFINSNNAEYGAAPTIESNNSKILKNLIQKGVPVKFLKGIYLFNEPVSISTTFKLRGNDAASTLLWFPKSRAIEYLQGGASNPYMFDLKIEALNEVIYTRAWTVNAFHAPHFERCSWVSYSADCFWNDNTTLGGTGCPIYGLMMTKCAICAPNDRMGINNWGSNSGIYNSVVDEFIFFNSVSINRKGIMNSLFFNCSCRLYCNSNITYHGVKFLLTLDEVRSSLCFFTIKDNVFEAIGSLEYIVNIQNWSNLSLVWDNNRLISMGYDRIINTLPINLNLSGDSTISLIKGESDFPINANDSASTIYSKSKLIHSNNTKRDIRIAYPNSNEHANFEVLPTAENFEIWGVPEILIPEDLTEVRAIVVFPDLKNGTIPKYGAGAGKNKIGFGRNEKSQLTFWDGWKYRNIDGTSTEKVYIIDNAEYLKKLHSMGVAMRNSIFRIVDDIDLGGATIHIRDNNVISCEGGSISNGTLGLSANVELRHLKGDCTIAGNPKGMGLRPENPIKGESILDTNLNKPIWWTGSQWLDATGAEV